MGVMIDTKEINVSESIELTDQNNITVGELRSGVYSPHFKKVIGIAMLNKPYWEVSQTIKISLDKKIYFGEVCKLPFL